MGEHKAKRVVVEKPYKTPRQPSPNEVRQRLYECFEVYGFMIIDGKYLYAFLSYIDHKGSQVFTCRMFFSTIEFLPYDKRVEIYKEMAPYLKKKFVKNPHLMTSNVAEIQKYMKYYAKSIEII